MIPVYSIQDFQIFSPGERSRILARDLECSEPVAAFLDSREGEKEELRELLRGPSLLGQLGSLHLGAAAEEARRLWKTAVPGKRVFVWGDYDVDGVSSTVIALTAAQECGASEAVYYIPDRRSEGYGLHASGVRSLIEDGFDTLIVVDCGSKDVEAVKLARSAGLNVMIFDHHAAEGEIVDLPTLVNPQVQGDEASRTLCATALLWCWAAQSHLLRSARLNDLLQLAALATVSDCMALSPLNLALTREGIAMMRKSPLRGLRELLRALCPGEPVSMIDEQKLAMRVIPCLNAAGRVDVADVAVRVLSGCGDQAELEHCVSKLLELNRRRRDISAGVCASVTARRKEGEESQVFFDASWPVGILSAVASRLSCEHKKAFALAAPSGKCIRGTLRVPEGANAVELLKGLDDALLGWGGHKSAAGFSVSHIKWQRFARELDARLKGITVVRRPLKVIEMEPERITLSAWEELLRLGPFGNGNPAPLFYVGAQGGFSCSPLGKKGGHLKVLCGGVSLLAFGAAAQIEGMKNITGWLYRPRRNYWQGRVGLQYVVEGIVAG